MSDDKKISMIHQQDSLAGELTTFMHQFGWWDFACTLQYHQTITFMEGGGEWCLSAMDNVYFEVKKCVGNAFSNDLEIQIYWLSKQ